MASNSVDFVSTPFKVLENFMVENAADLLGSKDAMKLHAMMSEMVLKTDPRTIPVMNGLKRIDSLPCQSVVKFRGMIQDMFDPEFYVSFYKTKETSNGFNVGLYKDALNDCDASIDFNSEKNVTLSRTSYLCISVPGENQWIRDKLNPGVNNPGTTNPGTTNPGINNPGTTMGSRNDGHSSPPKKDHRLESESVEEGGSKKLKKSEGNESSAEKSSKPKLEEAHFFPINDSNKYRKVFLLQVYDPNVNLKLNDIVEVIGIIDFGSVAPEEGRGEEEEKKKENGSGRGDSSQVNEVRSLIQGMELEDTGFNVSSRLVPRIHVLVINKIKDMNPLTSIPSNVNIDVGKEKEEEEELPLELSFEFNRKIRNELHAILTQALFGDSLAADYLICNLISRIYLRKDILSLGSFPLSIYNLPRMEKKGMESLIQSMYQLLSSLVTHSVYFPLSLESLNKGRFIPRKDYTLNKLLPGNLQLASNMWILIDETAMDPGLLTVQGVNNLKALRELIQWQKLRYDFTFHSLEMETDVTVLVLSQGKSMLPVNFGIPLLVTIRLIHTTFTVVSFHFSFILLWLHLLQFDFT